MAASFKRALGRIWEGIWPLIWPPRCALCGEFIGPDLAGFCPQCQASFRTVSFPICHICGKPLPEISRPAGNICGFCIESGPRYDRSRLYVRYEGAIAEVLKDFKFQRKRSMLPALSAYMVTCYEMFYEGQSFDMVLPVPLHRRRLHSRGFNQAADLARPIAKRQGCGVQYNVLERTRDTIPQYGLSVSQREKNVKGAFRVSRPQEVKEKSVLLVDDIMTTGTTVNECARVLRKAGAAHVCVLCLAGSFPA